MLEFVFRQETLNEAESGDKFNSFRIIAVKNIIRRWCDRLKDTFCQNIKTP